jgi:hypothetical protein
MLQKLHSYESKLENIIKEGDTLQSIFLQSHVGRYVIVLTAGYFEESVRLSLVECFRRKGVPGEVLQFINNRVKFGGSINRKKLEILLNAFRNDWYPSIELLASDAEKAAVDSVKTLRDKLAHGEDVSFGYSTARSNYFRVKQYTQRLIEIVLD